MSAFDRDFFFELSKIDQPMLAAINYGGYRPDVCEMHSCNMVSDRFKLLTAGIRGDVFKASRKFKLHEYFRGVPRHIYTYSENHSFRKQLNIAFSVEDVPEEYDGSEESFAAFSDQQCTARIGVGFRINSFMKNEGAIDYFEWERVVRDHQPEFNAFFASLGNYAEPVQIFDSLTALKVLDNPTDYEDDWRFFGKRLTLATDATTLTDYKAFIDEAVRVFTAIDQSIFC